MVQPLKMKDVVLMEQLGNRKDLEKFFPWILANNLKVSSFTPTSFPDPDMNLVIWNVRGDSKNDFIPYAWDIISNHKPSIFIILETKNNEDRANAVGKYLGFDKCLVVPADGRRGGVWCFYNPDVVSLILHTEKTPNYFHALFKLNPSQPEILITGVYAPSTSSKRHELWNELKSSLPPLPPLG